MNLCAQVFIRPLAVFYKYRFDVSGVHPKNKTPGTFTQVVYDKKCMLEIVSVYLYIYAKCAVHNLPQSPTPKCSTVNLTAIMYEVL